MVRCSFPEPGALCLFIFGEKYLQTQKYVLEV